MSVFKFIFKYKRINKSTDIAEASFSLSHDVPEAWWKETACNSSLRDLWMPSCCLPSAFEWKSLKPILEKTTGKKFSGRKSQGLLNIKKKSSYPTVIIIIAIISIISPVRNPTESKVFQNWFTFWVTGQLERPSGQTPFTLTWSTRSNEFVVVDQCKSSQ